MFPASNPSWFYRLSWCYSVYLRSSASHWVSCPPPSPADLACYLTWRKRHIVKRVVIRRYQNNTSSHKKTRVVTGRFQVITRTKKSHKVIITLRRRTISHLGPPASVISDLMTEGVPRSRRFFLSLPGLLWHSCCINPVDSVYLKGQKLWCTTNGHSVHCI